MGVSNHYSGGSQINLGSMGVLNHYSGGTEGENLLERFGFANFNFEDTVERFNFSV